MVEITIGARRFSSAIKGTMRSAPGTYSAPAGYTKSICVSMSKKTVFILHLFVQSHQFGAVLDSVLLVGVEQTPDGRGQALYRCGGGLTGCAHIRQRLDKLAIKHHGTKKSAGLGLIRSAAQAFPRTRDHILTVESKHLLRPRQCVLVFAELGGEATIQLHQLVHHAQVG